MLCEETLKRNKNIIFEKNIACEEKKSHSTNERLFKIFDRRARFNRFYLFYFEKIIAIVSL